MTVGSQIASARLVICEPSALRRVFVDDTPVWDATRQAPIDVADGNANRSTPTLNPTS